MKAVKHPLKSQTLMAHRVLHTVPGGCHPLHPYGVVRWFLDFCQEAPCPNGMGNAALDQYRVPWLHLKPVQALKHPVYILPVKQAHPLLSCDAFLKSHVYTRFFSIDGPAAQNMPALRLSVFGSEQLPCLIPVRVHLDSQPLRGINEFYQHAHGSSQAFHMVCTKERRRIRLDH